MKKKQPEQVKVGTIIGRRRVIRRVKRGPYTYVDVICTCSEHSIRRNIPLAQLVRGRALSCGCWTAEIRAAEQIAWEKFRATLLSLRQPVHMERENVLKRFFPSYTPKRPSSD